MEKRIYPLFLIYIHFLSACHPDDLERNMVLATINNMLWESSAEYAYTPDWDATGLTFIVSTVEGYARREIFVFIPGHLHAGNYSIVHTQQDRIIPLDSLRVSFFTYEGDGGLNHVYRVIDDVSYPNWLRLDRVGHRTVSGAFELTMVVERRGLILPNDLPDTLYIRDGIFCAKKLR